MAEATQVLAIPPILVALISAIAGFALGRASAALERRQALKQRAAKIVACGVPLIVDLTRHAELWQIANSDSAEASEAFFRATVQIANHAEVVDYVNACRDSGLFAHTTQESLRNSANAVERLVAKHTAIRQGLGIRKQWQNERAVYGELVTKAGRFVTQAMHLLKPHAPAESRSAIARINSTEVFRATT